MEYFVSPFELNPAQKMGRPRLVTCSWFVECYQVGKSVVVLL